ncbi:MAG: Gfo/Idh/MocA family oxidoreductase, partial [Dehalococcoidia bacterium]
GNHANRIMAPAITRAKNSRLVAVCSRDSERAQAFARAHGAEHTYTSYEDLLRDPKVDAIYIATPNALHAAQAIQAAGARRHVLCEKPLTLTVAEAERVVQASRDAGTKLGVALQNRFHPAHIEMRRLIQSGEAGEILLLQGEYSRDLTQPTSTWKADVSLAGGGAIMGMGNHVFDLFRFLTGQEVEEVTAWTDATTWNLPVDDMVMAMLRFSGGVRATMVSGYYVPRAYNSVVAYGSRARLTGLGTVGMTFQGTLLVEKGDDSTKMEFPAEDPITDNYVRMIEAFVRAVDEDLQPTASGDDGLELVRIVDAVLESARTGKSVGVNRGPMARLTIDR